MKKILYIIIQCTWGFPSTFIGLLLYIINRKCEHKWYRCCIDTHWNSSYGVSLGLFIFTPKVNEPSSQQIRVHEYGHTIQNLVLGPFMMFVGVISFTWCNHPYFERMRKEKELRYTACFVESWASRWGEKITGEKAI